VYKRILVPLDGSGLAEGALPYAEGVAIRLHSEVILLSICPPGGWFERPMKAYLEKRAGELSSLGIKASPLVAQGNAADGILDFAEKNDIDLIIISTHGHTGPSIWPLGSITSKILQKSRTPILLIRSRELEAALREKELRKILVPLDGSQFAEGIIPYVEDLTEGMDNEVILIRIIEQAQIPDVVRYTAGFDGKKYEDELIARAEKEAKRYLSKKESALRNKGVEVSSTSLLGMPAQTILQYAEDNSVSLIALSTHGFSGITKWAYGSVASKIIESSSKPVLLVRPPLPSLNTQSIPTGSH
jgi:nucleotide-binding universal stress UspA family protein